MSFCQHVPGSPLGQYVDWFWYYDDWRATHPREHVLPDGTFELIINLHEEPRKLFDRHDPAQYQSFRRGWLSGAQSKYLVIDVLDGSAMIGAHFKPGGAASVLGMPATDLRDRVVELDALWGSSAWDWREQLLAARGPQAKFRVLEALLLERLRRNSAPANGEKRVTWALQRFLEQPHVTRIGAVADKLGVSHKHFIQEFHRQVGLTPKLFCRIRRFQEVLSQINSQATVEWVDLAYDCGYFDQAHFVNDFQAFSGVNPTAYLSHRLEYPGFIRAAQA
jgi:AraC-like DNA-binding protein